MRISDWSSDVCSSYLTTLGDGRRERFAARAFRHRIEAGENIFLLAGHDAEKPLASTEAGSLSLRDGDDALHIEARVVASTTWATDALAALAAGLTKGLSPGFRVKPGGDLVTRTAEGLLRTVTAADLRSEEHTSELQSLMRISYAVFCLKKK